MPWQAVELWMVHAIRTNLTTLSSKIKYLSTIEHRQLVCLQVCQPTRSTADHSSRDIQRGSHAALLQLWPSVRFEVGESVVHRDHGGPLSQGQLSLNALLQLPNSQGVEPLRKQSIQLSGKLRAGHGEGAEITCGCVAHRVVEQDRDELRHAVVRSTRRLCRRLSKNRLGPD